MEKERQVKLLSIVALVLAIFAMTLGFAAFSTTLTISSSATVTPNNDDFKIKIYGVKDQESLNDFGENDYVFDENYLSNTVAAAAIEYSLTNGNSISATDAIIDNNTYTISGLKGTFGNDVGGISYPIIVRNEGKYDAYIDLSDFINDSVVNRLYTATCVGDEDATESLVTAACSGLNMVFTIMDRETGESKIVDDNFYKIPVNSDELFAIMIIYEGPFSDGDFEASFPNIELKFSTTK